MNNRIRQRLTKGKNRIARRLARARRRKDSGQPVFPQTKVTYEMSDRVRVMPHGGLRAAHLLVLGTGLVRRLDEGLELLKIHKPYHESDHVLNIAYNTFCGGQTLDDIEQRRNDEVFLDALEVEAIPDPTTAGDFCRRFEAEDIETMMDAINESRLEVWKRQGPEFTAGTAYIDSDGTLLPTTGECKEGMSLSYKGIWGYHPLLISLANTAEPLFIVNRSGSRPSYEGAAAYLDKAIALCRRGGFSDILLRGDTDFSQTEHLDRWDADGVRFVFGYDSIKKLKGLADGLEPQVYGRLIRQAKTAFLKGKSRTRQPRVKEEVVRRKGYKNIRLVSEDVAEFDYRPGKCKKTYRMVVLRKNLTVERGAKVLFDDIR